MLKYLKPTKNSSPLIISTYQIQNFGSVICGQLCLYVLFMLGSGYKFLDIITELFNNKLGAGLLTDLIPKDFKLGMSDGDVNAIDDVATIAELI